MQLCFMQVVVVCLVRYYYISIFMYSIPVLQATTVDGTLFCNRKLLGGRCTLQPGLSTAGITLSIWFVTKT